MSIGFIKLHRKITEWEWYSDKNTSRLFIHLLISANHISKKWKGVIINRGEYLTGRIELSKETGLSQQEIRTSLTKLKSTSEITIRSTNKFSIVKLENYHLYQDKEIANQPSDQPTNHQTINQQSTTTKECKELKENKNKNIDNQFEEFWQLYKPIHTSKGDKKKSKDLFIKILDKNKFESIVQGLKMYMQHCHNKNSYTKQVQVWLKGRCWEEEYEVNQSQLNTSQSLCDFVNKIAKHTLITKIVVSSSNKAALYFDKKEDYHTLAKLPQNLKDEIKQKISSELKTNDFEYKY